MTASLKGHKGTKLMKVTKGIVSLLSKRKVELVRTQTDTYRLTDGLMFLGAYQSVQTIIVAKSLTPNCWHSSTSLLLYLPGELRVAGILTIYQHTGHTCSHASCHRGHGLGHFPGYKRVFHFSLGFQTPYKVPLGWGKKTSKYICHFPVFNFGILNNRFTITEWQTWERW